MSVRRLDHLKTTLFRRIVACYTVHDHAVTENAGIPAAVSASRARPGLLVPAPAYSLPVSGAYLGLHYSEVAQTFEITPEHLVLRFASDVEALRVAYSDIQAVKVGPVSVFRSIRLSIFAASDDMAYSSSATVLCDVHQVCRALTSVSSASPTV